MSLTLPPELLSHMPNETRAEFISRAYVYAVAARAGVNVTKPEFDFGVDFIFTRIGKETYGLRDMLYIPLTCQLKSSKDCEYRGDEIYYVLEAKNYKDLVRSSSSILILLWLPAEIDKWIAQSENSLHLFKCAYFYKIKPEDRKEVPNKTRVTIHFPRSQVFTAEALLQLIDEIQPRLEL